MSMSRGGETRKDYMKILGKEEFLEGIKYTGEGVVDDEFAVGGGPQIVWVSKKVKKDSLPLNIEIEYEYEYSLRSTKDLNCRDVLTLKVIDSSSWSQFAILLQYTASVRQLDMNRSINRIFFLFSIYEKNTRRSYLNAAAEEFNTDECKYLWNTLPFGDKYFWDEVFKHSSSFPTTDFYMVLFGPDNGDYFFRPWNDGNYSKAFLNDFIVPSNCDFSRVRLNLTVPSQDNRREKILHRMDFLRKTNVSTTMDSPFFYVSLMLTLMQVKMRPVNTQSPLNLLPIELFRLLFECIKNPILEKVCLEMHIPPEIYFFEELSGYENTLDFFGDENLR